MGKAINKKILGLLLICLVFPGTAVGEAENSASCEQRYEALYTRHSQTLSNYDHGSPEFYSELHDIEGALFDAFVACPNAPFLFVLMAETQISIGNPQLAFLYAKRAHKWAPDIWQTNHILGSAMCMMEQYDKGIPLLQRAVNLSPHNASLHFNLCSSQHAAGYHHAAVEVCTTLINMKGHTLQGPAYFVRGKAYQVLGEHEAAKSDFDRARVFGYMELPVE